MITAVAAQHAQAMSDTTKQQTVSVLEVNGVVKTLNYDAMHFQIEVNKFKYEQL